MRQTSALNRRAVAIIAALSLTALLAGLALWVVQQRRVRQAALIAIQERVDAEDDEQAIRQLADYLKSWPRDVAALRLMAEATARPILRDHRAGSLDQLKAAVAHNEALLLNLDASADADEIQDVCKRLIELYVGYGDASKLLFRRVYQAAPGLIQHDPYSLAQKLVPQVVQHEAAEAARAKRPFDPDVCRLEAMAAAATLSANSTPAEIKRVAAGYRAALLGTPGDPERMVILGNPCPGRPDDLATAAQFCSLFVKYYDVFRDDPRFQQDLVDIERGLIEAHPDSAKVRLLYYQVHAEARGQEAARDVPDPALITHHETRARAEIDAALEASPESVAVRLAAARDAMRRSDLDGAAGHVRAIDAEQRANDPQVALVEGMLAWAYDQPVSALEIWRQSLVESGGTDVQLTWWLAYTNLQTGHLPKARRLIDAYGLQAGTDSPLYQLLEAGFALRDGQLEQAREALGQLRDVDFPETYYKVKVELFLAELFKARNEPNEVKSAYDRAVRLDPRNPEPRVARAQFIRQSDPDLGLDDLRTISRAYPSDAYLGQALATALLERLAVQAAAGRNFTEVDGLLETLRKVDGQSASLALLMANRHLLGDQPEQALAILAAALKPTLSESPPASSDPPADAIEQARSKRGEDLLLAYVEALTRLDRRDDADRALALASQPWNYGDRPAIRVARAYRLLAQGHGREAQALLGAEVPEYSSSDQGRLKESLGQVRLSQGDLSGARAAFDAWYRISGDYRAGLAQLDLAILSGDLRLSEDILTRLKQPPRRSESAAANANSDFVATLADTAYQVRRLEVANAETRAKMIDEARDALERLEKQVPNLPTVHLLRGRFEETRGLVDEAVKAYKLAWADGQGSSAALTRLVGLYVRHKEYDGELDQLRKQQRIVGGAVEQLAVDAAQDGANRETLVRLAGEMARSADMPTDQRSYWARRLLTLGQAGQAVEALREITRQKPQDPMAWFDLIRAQASRGDAAAAAGTVEQARQRVKTKRPDLFEARCLWSANDLGGADRTYQRILDKAPDDVDALQDLALLARERRDTDRMIANLRRVVQLDPERRASRFDLASALAESGDPKLWDEAWTLLGEVRPDETADERLARAVVLIRAADPSRKAQAIPTLETLLADLAGADPLAVPTRKFLAREYLVAGRPDQAQTTLLPLTLMTDDATALALMIEARLAQRRPEQLDEARNLLRRLAQADPNYEGLPRYQLAIAVAGSGASNPNDALVKGVEQALASADEKTLPQASAIARMAVEQALAQSPPALDAVEAIARLLAPRLPGSAWILATAQAHRGQPDRALATCAEAMPKARGRDRFDLARVACEVAVGPKATPEMIAQAESIIADAGTDGPADANLLVVEAILRHRQGRYEDEAKLCRKALEIDPRNAMARNNLAWVLSEGLNQPSEALELIDGLIAQIGRKNALLDTRGMILLRLGRTPEAIHDLEEAGKPTASATKLLHLAGAYLKAGQEAEFRKARDQARKLGVNLDALDPTERAEFARLLDQP